RRSWLHQRAVRQGDVLQEDAVLAEDEPFPPGELVILAAQTIFGKARAIGLIGGEALDIVDAVGGGRRPFVGAEIADQIRAAARDGLAPIAAVFGEGLLAE